MGGLHLGEHIEFVCPLWAGLHLPGKHCCLRFTEQWLSFFPGRWVHTLVRAGRLARRESSVFFIRPQSLLLYPQWWTVSIFHIANHGSPKARFDGSAEGPQHWAGTKSISPAEAIFNPPLFVSDPTVMWSQGESFCLADLGDKLSSFFR